MTLNSWRTKILEKGVQRGSVSSIIATASEWVFFPQSLLSFAPLSLFFHPVYFFFLLPTKIFPASDLFLSLACIFFFSISHPFSLPFLISYSLFIPHAIYTYIPQFLLLFVQISQCESLQLCVLL